MVVITVGIQLHALIVICEDPESLERVISPVAGFHHLDSDIVISAVQHRRGIKYPVTKRGVLRESPHTFRHRVAVVNGVIRTDLIPAWRN